MSSVRVCTKRASPASMAIALAWAIVIVMSGFMQTHAQGPTAIAARQARVADRLPVKRVVLYKSGVGYFEHLGQVRGNQTVTIDFTSGQLDDVLKSLTTLDLDGGRVSGISYNSEAALDRRLSALRLPVGQETTRAQFLSALRGARLEVRAAGTHFTGRLLSVESRAERNGHGTVTETDTLSLVSDAGEIRTVALRPGVTVRVSEAGLSDQIGQYLSLVASVRDEDLRHLTIATNGTGSRDLFVSYVSEVPVWKATYRLVLPSGSDSRKPLLQGWAIVDNTVGQDWDNVELSLVAGAPQSFVQSISRPYYVQRPVMPMPERMLLSPQTHQAALATSGAGALAGTVTDPSGGALPGVTVVVTKGGGRVAQAVTNMAGRYQFAAIPPGAYDISFTMNGFRSVTRSSIDVSGGMETVLNVTMEIGRLSEAVTVFGSAPVAASAPPPAPFRSSGVSGGRGSGAGFGGGSGLAERVDVTRSAQQIETAAAELGDLFEYKLKEPVTIRKNQSALVPILSADVGIEKVSLWNATSSLNRPLRAVWVINSTGLTLDAGSFTVIEGQAFAGEGLTEPLKAGEKRLLSYATDLGVVVDAKGETVPSRVTRVQVSRGLVIQQTEERQRRTYTARNEDAEARVLVVEHPARSGWTLGGDLKPVETTPAWHRFRVPIAPKTTATFTVEESHPTQSQFAVNLLTDDQVALLVRDQAIAAPVEAALRQVLARKTEIARLSAEIAVREGEITQISRDQERVRENMKSLKGSGEERQLLQRYVRQLDQQETRLEALRGEVRTLSDARQKAQTDLGRFIEGLSG